MSASEADLIAFFRTPKKIIHQSHDDSQPHEHYFFLHDEGDAPHVDVTFPGGCGLSSSVSSEEELEQIFEDPNWRLPGTLNVLASCKGNYAMTLRFAMDIYQSFLEQDNHATQHTLKENKINFSKT